MKFWKDCVTQLKENGPIFCQMLTASFITITRQYMQRISCSNIWQSTELYSVASLRTDPITMWLFSRLFPILKVPLKGQRFDIEDLVKTNAMNALKVTPKNRVNRQKEEIPMEAHCSFKWGLVWRKSPTAWQRISPVQR